jgi:hypothetical protein
MGRLLAVLIVITKKKPDYIHGQCSQFTYFDRSTGTTEYFEALPAFRDDRFCYRSTTRDYRSWMHWRFNNGKVFWLLTDFASENPNSYNWMNLDQRINELDVPRGRNTGGEEDMGPVETLRQLRTQGFIKAWHREDTFRSPLDEFKGLQCTEEGRSDAPTQKQCQGACYYENYPLAFSFTSDSNQHPNECLCGKECTFSTPGPFFRYTVNQWFEGFFIDGTTVNILAMTDYDELNVQMWVKVSDRCGNSAVTKVEFWVAPSLEAAAAQGRVCVDATVTPDSAADGAFSSDDPSSPHSQEFFTADDRVQHHLDIIQQNIDNQHNHDDEATAGDEQLNNFFNSNDDEQR